jgi:(S)-2-hydroxy-acid oxidase
MQKLAHADGELATSRAASKLGLGMVLSSYSTVSMEEVIDQGKGNPYAIQMCILRDRSIALQLLRRAEGKYAHS